MSDNTNPGLYVLGGLGPLASGARTPLSVDNAGRLIVVPGGGSVLSLTPTLDGFTTIALEASHAFGVGPPKIVYTFTARVDSTLATGTYYIQLYDSAAVPPNGAVTFVSAPLKVQHTIGTDDYVNADFGDNGVALANGLSCAISTTEFTKTLGTAFCSFNATFL